jgi:xylan 1,4-beta-xylosidase
MEQLSSTRADLPQVISASRRFAALFLSVVAGLAFAPTAHAEVVLTASVADNQGSFAHPFTFVNDFWPRSVPADYKQKHPFLEYHSIFNAFGSNPSKRSLHELYDETTPYPHYQFQRLTGHIDTVLAAGLKPYLTLGNCPIDLASNQTIGFYNTMIYGPAPGKWDTYRDFVTAFFDDLNTKYGHDEVASWRYRFMTEQDNNQWWVAGADEWFKFYDYTVSGARQANADVRISPGNLMRHAPGTYGTWLVPFANRIQNDIFSIGNEHTEKPDRVTFSLYSPWRVNQSSGPNVLSVDTSAIRAALAPYPMFDNIPLGIDEGYVGVDENNKTLWARVDGTEWGATHFAYLAQQMIDENWDVGSLWEPGDPDLPQPMRNVLEILDTMDGMTKITIPVTSGTPPSNNEVAALAATDGSSTKVMLANYHYWRTSSTPTDYRIRLTDLAPGDYKVTETRIDKDHGNYRTQWLIDSAGFPRPGNFSQYDMKPLVGLTDPDAFALWNANYATYQAMANDMDMGTATYAVDSSGILDIVVQLPAHAVSFFDIASALLGDFNGNGVVDAADYTLWRDNLGGDSSVLSGNGSGSATVVQADYDLWKQNFGSYRTVSGTAIPEPSSLLMMGLVLAIASGLRRSDTHIGLPVRRGALLPRWQKPTSPATR